MDKLLRSRNAVNSRVSQTTGAPRAFIRYELERLDYSVTSFELQQLTEGGQNHWKDFCLVSLTTGLACALNAAYITSTQEVFKLTLPIFLFSLFGVVGLGLSICFAILWRQTSGTTDTIISGIKQKPLLEILPRGKEERGTRGYVLYAAPDPSKGESSSEMNQ